ncbi:SA1362 family protein [Cytobacillus gottheilii]|uniref:SA1362 family protein n=1 Tax=Cytobacillus gottheilii TaxID=859144 RepID=UPI001FE4CC53|nr:SA1362 family protein [Cytobacillus gottheilii]
MAFLKNRVSFYVVAALIVLGVLGIAVSVFSDPAGVLRTVAISAIVIAIVYFLITRVTSSNSGNKENRAFKQAARKSKKRFMKKDATSSASRKTKTASLTSIKKPKKKSSVQLTVIEGKKSKRKNRASL